MQSYQPYGQQALAPVPHRGVERRMHKSFGITYIAVRSILCGIVILLLLFAASLVVGEGSGEFGAIMGIVALVFVAWLGYAIAGGVLAIKGNFAGPIMGLVDAGLSSLLFIGTLFSDGNVVGTMCWVLPNILIIVFGILAIKERQQGAQQSYGSQGYGAPVYASPAVGGYYNPQYATQGGYQNPQYGVSPPRSASGGTSAAVPSPKQAALGILVLAASVDPDFVNEALPRARAVAAKLLGSAAQARIQRQLARPVSVMDVEQDLWQHTSILNQENNAQMKANVVKAVQYVLKGPNGVEPLGEQFIRTLKQQLGA